MGKIKSFEDLKNHLDEWAYGEEIANVEDFLEKQGAKWCDEGIDDGGEEEGEYLMYVVFSFNGKDIKLYYSNLDEEVSYIQYRG